MQKNPQGIHRFLVPDTWPKISPQDTRGKTCALSRYLAQKTSRYSKIVFLKILVVQGTDFFQNICCQKHPQGTCFFLKLFGTEKIKILDVFFSADTWTAVFKIL